jgi:hypothetical protein
VLCFSHMNNSHLHIYVLNHDSYDHTDEEFSLSSSDPVTWKLRNIEEIKKKKNNNNNKNKKKRHTRVYPKVFGLATCSENCKRYSSLPLGAVVSIFCESV